MYTIIEKVQEPSGKWRVRSVVSESESMFLWFPVEPDQIAVDAAIDAQLAIRVRQEALSNQVIESINTSACSAWQMRKALNTLGLRDAVEAAVAASGDRVTQDGWEYAGEFLRYDPLVVQFGMVLGKNDAEMDALFELARSL